MKWFDANGTDVDAYPDASFRGGVYDSGVLGARVAPDSRCATCRRDDVPPSICAREHATRYRVVCGWCKKVLEVGPPDAKVSHGICDACSEKVVGTDARD